MKRGTVAVAVLLALGLILSMGFSSWADPWGMGGQRWQHKGHCGHHGKFAKLTPEQVGKLFDLRQKFLDDTAGLRKDMAVKRAELRVLWRADNPDEKQILAKLKEISSVKAKFQEKAVPFRIEVKKLLPKPQPPKAAVSLDEERLNLDNVLALEPVDHDDWEI